MYEKVDKWIDLAKNEHEILDFWNKTDAFEKLRKLNEGKTHWSFLDGPITANNPMGVHHAWGRTLKDVYQRYYAMNGRELRYQNGFDCQGLWVEVEVEKELGFKSKRDIEDYGVDKFVDKCKERVLKFSKIQTEQSIRLGYWMDWTDSYFTMTEENNYTIWGFLKKCHDQGLIYKGNDVMPWCVRCGTGISQQEMHEGYKDVADASVFLRFPVRGRDKEALMVWTTTPWTLTSNVAAAVHPELEYARVRQGDWTYILAAELVEQVMGGEGKFEVLEKLPGEKLVGLEYDGPYDELDAISADVAPNHRVIPWDEVSAASGSGIVHIAPGCGKEDMELGLEHDLASVCPIDESGVFTSEFGRLAGKHAQEASEEIFEDLDEKGVLYKTEEFTHSYPHCWRCGTALLFRRVDEWFIAMDPWRDRIKKVAKQINWIPSFGLSLELDWLTNMRDWMISKKRYWGLALPIWVCGDCGSFDVIGSREELQERAVEGWDEFDGNTPHKPWIDKVKIACPKCGKPCTRIADVGNPWLDAGIVPYSTVRYNTDRDYWEKWIPADLVLECFPGQFRNWFYVLLAMSTMMEDIPPFKTLLGHALIRDENGEEMHKSHGNAIWFDDAVEEMSADVMRWMYCGHDVVQNLNFSYKAGKEIRRKFFNTLWNTYGFFVNYARLADWTPPAEPTPLDKRTDFDRWILSNLQLVVRTTRENVEKYNIRGAIVAMEKFADQLSNWYVRQNRRRFWKTQDDADCSMAFETLYTCIETFIRLCAPMIPFVTENMYRNLVRSHDENAPESVHHTEFPVVDEAAVDEELSAAMDSIIKLNTMTLATRDKASLKVRQPLPKLIVGPTDDDERAAAERFTYILKETLNFKEVEIRMPGDAPPVTYVPKPDFAALGKKLGKKMQSVRTFIEDNPNDVLEKKNTGEALTIDTPDGVAVIEADEILLDEKTPENLVVSVEGESWVAVDTTISDELRLEGMMRDVLRRLQVLRKDVGLEIEDRIALRWDTDSADMESIVDKWGSYMDEELLVTSREKGLGGGDAHEVKVGGGGLKVQIERSS